MPPRNLVTLSPNWQESVRGLIIFTDLYLLESWVVEPHLLYHRFGVNMPYPVFYAGWDFMKSSLAHPGGAVEYAGAFLSQWYYYSWAGAVIVTVVSWTVCSGFGRYLSMVGRKRYAFVGYLPAAAILMMQCRYDHPLNLLLAMTAALWAAVVYAEIAPKNRPVRAGMFVVMYAVLYHLAGGGAVLFAILTMLHEILNRRNYLAGVIIPVFSAGFVWFWGIHISDMYWANAFRGVSAAEDYSFLIKLKWSLVAGLPLMPFDPKMEAITRTTAQALNIFIVFAGLLVCLPQMLQQRRQRTHKKAMRKVAEEPTKKSHHLRKWAAGTIVLLLLTVACGRITFDSSIKKLHRIDYLASQERWSDVLAEAKGLELREYNFLVNHDINLALFYTGRLTERMFEYPQRTESLLMVFGRERVNSSAFLRRARLFLDMGMVGMAEKTAYEILEMTGDHPEIIELLARVNLVKGDMETAGVYLRALARNMVRGQYGAETLELLEQDPDMSGSEEIRQLRRVAVDVDDTSLRFNADKVFGDLLGRNPNNRMAFEYMMAYYLLTRQVDKVAAHIHRLENFGFKKLPRYYEEALVIHMGPEAEKTLLPDRWRPGKEAVQRAWNFSSARNQFGKDEKSAIRKLAKEYGDSYYYYYLFKVSGVKP